VALEGTIANLAHENTLLRRRLYGNKTERSVTNELQLALGDLLAGEAQLQKDSRPRSAPPTPRPSRRLIRRSLRAASRASRGAVATCSRASCRATRSRSSTKS
jgi:hypothetical protein